MAPGYHHSTLPSTRRLTAKHRQEDCASARSAGTQFVTDLVNSRSEKLLVTSPLPEQELSRLMHRGWIYQ